jgi:hypothetical protein
MKFHFKYLPILVLLVGCTPAVSVEEPIIDERPETTEEAVEVSSDLLLELLTAEDEANENVSISWDDDYFYMESNSLPDHETGDFPNQGNPNTISEISAEYQIPRNPVYLEDAKDIKIFGVTFGGVSFDPGTAERDEATDWNIEGLQDLFDLGMDFNNAHVQPSGKYHYHGIPTSLENTDHAPVAFAADGFPVFIDEDYESSYAVRSGERTDDEPDGSYDGTYTQDFEYIEDSGDLDTCNGTFITNDYYPDGTYAYFLTDSFPFVPRCLHGEADPSFEELGNGPEPGGSGPGGFGPPPPRK